MTPVYFGCTNQTVIMVALFFFSISCSIHGQGRDQKQPDLGSSTVYQFTLNDIGGKPVSLSEFQGKVILLVNVASRCGFTGQYSDLQKLFEKYSPRGFVIMGFPANDFFGQEPGTNEEIKTFCTRTYGVTFPMFEKISVKGEKQHPLYKFLTEPATNPDFSGAISWNFNKFLIGRQGKILGRFGSMVSPSSSDLVGPIEKALEEK